MATPMCETCGESMICRVLTKTVNGKKIPTRRNKETGKPEPTCWFPCVHKNRPHK